MAATAVAGIVGAHLIDYALLVPDPAHRHDVLLRSGHGYLPFTLTVAAICGLAAVLASALEGARRGAGRDHPIMTMVLVQGGGFVALEAAERMSVGARFDRSVFLIMFLGVALQFPIAALTSKLLGYARRVGRAVAEALSRTPALPRVPRVIPAVVVAVPPRIGRSVDAHGVRGPPILVS